MYESYIHTTNFYKKKAIKQVHTILRVISLILSTGLLTDFTDGLILLVIMSI